MMDLIANRYAEAIFQIGEEDNKLDVIYTQLKMVSSLIEMNKDLNNAMKSPLISKSEKVQLIDTLFAGKIDNDLKNFLKILVEKARISYIKQIEFAYKELLNEKKNIVEGYVISAVPMEDAKIKELEFKLSKKYNKKIILQNKIDENILGGVLVRIGNTEIDGTIKTRLNKMRNELSQIIS